jgi:hypothetical protein
MIETRPQKTVAEGTDLGGHKTRQYLFPAAVSARGYKYRNK